MTPTERDPHYILLFLVYKFTYFFVFVANIKTEASPYCIHLCYYQCIQVYVSLTIHFYDII